MGVLEIERAIEALPETELAELTEWFARREAVWDTQIEVDGKAGKLDALIAAARASREEKTEMVQAELNSAAKGAAAKKIYRERIAARIAEGDYKKLLLIDIGSGDYEIGTDDLQMEDRLLTRHPDAAMVLIRADGGPVTGFGGL